MIRSRPTTRGAQLLRLALSDLLRRRTATALNVAQVAVAACYLLVLGSYGSALYRRQERTLERSVPRRIHASTDATDSARRFTDARCAELRATLRGVELLYPHVELAQARVRLPAAAAAAVEAVPAEGLLAEDPLLGEPFVAGGGFREGGARQAVLSRALFERLGGTIRARVPVPDQLLLALERTRAGAPQTQEVTLVIAGILEHAPAPDRVFLPAALASELDLWATGRVADFLGERALPAAWPGAVAYADPAQEHRVAEEARANGVELVRERVLEWITAPLDGLISRRDGRRLLGPARSRLIQQCQVRGLALVNEDAEDEFGVRIRVTTAAQLHGLTEHCAAASHELQWLQTPRIETLVRYAVHDPRRPDGVGSDLIQALALSRPTFVAARPLLSVAAAAAELDLVLFASDSKDPERMTGHLRAGRWLELARSEIVVPEALGDELDHQVAITVQRKGPGGRAERLTLPLLVVGVRAGSGAFVPQDLAQDLVRWERGELQFDESRGEFESQVEASLRFGHVRCNVYARSVDQVPDVVRQLQALGYRTEDQLREQQGLRELGSALVFGLFLFAGGLLLSAAASVLLSAWLHVKNRMHEIGIVRAHGVRTREVAAMFAAQGVTLGALSFVTAVVLVALGQPWFHSAVERVLGGGGVQASVFSADGLWLLPLALGVCLSFSLAGVILPAVHACRLPPAVALRRKE